MNRFWSWLVLLVVCGCGLRSAFAQGMGQAQGSVARPARSLREAEQRRSAARRFLAQRGFFNRSATAQVVAGTHIARRPQPLDSSSVFNLTGAWKALGPSQTLTPAYGAVTGRVTSIAIDSSDTSGNTVFLGTTGGGVWKSGNAAGAAAQVSFTPLTDQAPLSSLGWGSLSIGAVSVQPGGTGVVLAGTGDPNDALDSYYGQGILRSVDHGVTWQTIDEAVAGLSGAGTPRSFLGEGFAGFAWSSVSPNVVVAAVTQALDGVVVNALQTNSFEGLYYSTDAGATWQMASIVDGPGFVVQDASTPASKGSTGNAATAVIWNPWRQMFYAAVQYHGYYGSPDGVTWTRLAGQPGLGLSRTNCPTDPGLAGNALSCPMMRGALAVQPATGDMFAFTVAPFNTLQQGNPDQGIWRDVCAANGTACSTGTANMFSQQLPVLPLENGSGAIEEGDYDLWLAAVPASSGTDTLLYAGTEDIFKYSLLGGSTWQNLTNVNDCPVASIAPYQHAVAVSSVAGSMMFFGNDSGVWRTTDGIKQQSLCSTDLQNLNSGLGSLAEVRAIAEDPGRSGTLLASQGLTGSAATSGAVAGSPIAWPQILDGYGSSVEIDPENPLNWYAAGDGVSIYLCGDGSSCDANLFPGAPVIGDAQTSSDGETLLNPAVWLLDPQDPTKMIVGTCRVWRGSVSGATANWGSSNALSPVLNEPNNPSCNGQAQISALGASGTIVASGAVGNQEILYAGMFGTDQDGIPVGGATAAGHVFTQALSAEANGATAWTDISQAPSLVTNGLPNHQAFNPGGFTVSSVVVDTHDTTGQTVYATIQGFAGDGISEPTVYRSTNQGQSWLNVTANLMDIPVNGLVVDPGNANIVYVATDAGVFVTTNITSCATGASQCWSAFGTLLPDAPVTAIEAWGTGTAGLLRAATYGRGIWETPLVSAAAAGSTPPTAAVLSPIALVFTAQAVGTLSATKSITVMNAGSGVLTISAIEVTGDYNEQDDCSGAVAAGGHCVVTIAFDPQAVGVRDGLLTVLANVSGGQVTAALSGTASPAGQVALTPLTLIFPPTAIGAVSAAQYVTVANSGTVAVSLASPTVSGAYQIAGNTCTGSDPSQTSCTVGIVFAPTASGIAHGTFSIVAGTGALTALLSGSGLSPATDGLSGTSLTGAGLQFLPQLVGTVSATQTVVISNTGSEPLTLVTASSNSSDFIVKAGCTTVPANNTCAVLVSFAPTVAGSRTGTLTIADVLHSGAGAQTIAMIGTGVARSGVASVGPSMMDFGIEGVGSTSTPQAATLTNNGTATLTGLLFSATGNFQVSAGTCGTSLASGGVCQPAVSFTPATEGPLTGTLTITGGNQTFTTHLSGEGISYTLSAAVGLLPVSGASIETVVSGTTASYQVSVLPVGASTGSLAIVCSGAPSGYACSVNGGSVTGSVQLQAGQTSSVTITIAPVATASMRPTEGVRHNRLPAWGLGVLSVAFALPLWSLPKRRLWSLAALVLMVCLAGCAFTTKSTGGGSGAGGSGTGVTSGSPDSVTLTVSAPGIQKTANISLVVEQ